MLPIALSYAVDTVKSRISALQNDAEFERLIERAKALKRFIQEIDTEAIPSKRQQRVTSLAADYEEEFGVCKGLSDKRAEYRKGNILLSSIKCCQEWIVVMSKAT